MTTPVCPPRRALVVVGRGDVLRVMKPPLPIRPPSRAVAVSPARSPWAAPVPPAQTDRNRRSPARHRTLRCLAGWPAERPAMRHSRPVGRPARPLRRASVAAGCACPVACGSGCGQPASCPTPSSSAFRRARYAAARSASDKARTPFLGNGPGMKGTISSDVTGCNGLPASGRTSATPRQRLSMTIRVCRSH
jgi:hypothetical protein